MEGPEGYHTIGSNHEGTRVPAIDTQRPYGMTQKCFEKWEGPAIRRWGQGGQRKFAEKGTGARKTLWSIKIVPFCMGLAGLFI